MGWHRLNLIHSVNPKSASNPKSLVDVEVTLKTEREKEILKADFRVSTPKMNVNKKLAKGTSQHGLWNWDVVEIFIASQDPFGKFSAYYEFQVSPLGQFFELEIFEARRRMNKDFKSGFQINTIIESEKPGVWDACIYIPLAVVGHKPGNTLVGNIFACLGPEEDTQYYSAFLPPQQKPDFHLPQYFKKLI